MRLAASSHHAAQRHGGNLVRPSHNIPSGSEWGLAEQVRIAPGPAGKGSHAARRARGRARSAVADRATPERHGIQRGGRCCGPATTCASGRAGAGGHRDGAVQADRRCHCVDCRPRIRSLSVLGRFLRGTACRHRAGWPRAGAHVDLDDHRRLPDGDPIASGAPAGCVASGSDQLSCLIARARPHGQARAHDGRAHRGVDQPGVRRRSCLLWRAHDLRHWA